MYSLPMSTRAAATVFVLLVCCAGTIAQTFTLVPPAAGGSGTRVYGVSADGSTAAGYSSTDPLTAFQWTQAGGRNDFGALPGMPQNTLAYAISGDASTVAGSWWNGEDRPTAYRWSPSGGFESLGRLPGAEYSTARGVSGNGSVVVGLNEYGSGGLAFRWTQAEGMTSLGFTRPGHFFSEATAVSLDGVTIVGISFGASTSDAFAWTSATGMMILPGLPGTTTADARGVNFDGSIVVGASGSEHAVMWRNGVPIDLGLAPGYFVSRAEAVNDDGTVVVGSVRTFSDQYAAVWTPQTGMRTLVDFLALHGVTVPAGTSPLIATGVSADGNTIVGYTGLPGQVRQGFVATIPSPGWLGAAGALLVAGARRRRQTGL
ncbi:hypothetical protein PHYC_02422 [Phycisphaerales bacterium]|nr:hypothetical protein PHYC_02422 [Phycisphaerales bacterium]